MAPRGRAREMQGGPLTLEKYHRFFVDPWGTRLTIDHLNHIISMHGFIKLHRSNKGDIMRRLVGQVDLQPPRRSTLHRAAAGPSSDAVITADVVSADVDAIGWTECPIGSVAVLAASSPGDAPEPVEPDPRPANFVLAGRRARSKRSRSSAYGHRPDDGGSSLEEEEKENGEWLPPPPSTPPRCLRSPTPPPPPSSPPPPPPPPRETPRPPQPPHGTLPPPPPPREMVAVAPPPPPPPPPPYYGQPTLAPPPPPPPPPYCGQPTLAPLPPRPLHFGASPAVVSWLSWGLPLPATVPLPPPPFLGAHAFAQNPPPPPGQRPFWSSPTVPPCYPAPFWGAPFWGAQPPPPQPSPRPHWGHIRSPPGPALQQPPPPTMQQQQLPQPPPGVFWGRPAYQGVHC